MNLQPKLTPFELGRQHASLFLGFACFLHEQTARLQLDRLCFCTREGIFFKNVFDDLFNRNGDSVFAVSTALIEASRLSVFAPSAIVDGVMDFGRLFRLYQKQSLDSLLTSLGLNPRDFDDILVRHAVSAREIFDDPMANPRFSQVIEDEEWIARILPKLLGQRAAAIGYLKPHFESCRRIGIVDIGWQGTIQDAIARLFPNQDFVGLYLGLALQRNTMEASASKIAYGPNRNVSGADKDLLDAVNVLEFMCLSNTGSAVGYEESPDGSFVARMRQYPEEEQWIEEFSIPFQHGVLSVAAEAQPDLLMQEHQSGALRKNALAEWRKLLAEPPAALVKAYFSMKSNEEFGLGTVDDRSAVPSVCTVALSPFMATRRRQLIRYLTYTQWARGTLARQDLTGARRVLLYVLTKLALAYKSRLHTRNWPGLPSSARQATRKKA